MFKSKIIKRILNSIFNITAATINFIFINWHPIESLLWHQTNKFINMTLHWICEKGKKSIRYYSELMKLGV